jgi:hypothetical protein
VSIIRAVFEPGIWKDFSKEHRTLREHVEATLTKYREGRSCDQIAVWGAFGAGKTQFLYWVAERSLNDGLIPIYLHLNDLLDGLSDAPSPDTFRDHASAFVARIVDALRRDPGNQLLRQVFRDDALLAYVLERIELVDLSKDARPVLLVDEVEQAYVTLRETVRADDRSPLRAWLEEPTLKVCAFAVGSMYVLGKADRERMHILPIPAVRPSFAKELLKDIPEAAVNSLWWLSRGKPRHLMKAAHRFRSIRPTGAIEIHEFVKDLDSVSQAPYETDSQNVVPACYVENFQPDELAQLMAIGPAIGQGDGKLFPLTSALEPELLTIVRDAFKMEAVAFDLVRYLMMLLEAMSVDGHFALRESDTPYLLRLAVDFLLEYERDRLEKETLEGGAALRKLLEAHDSAEDHAGEIFWKLQGKVGANLAAVPAVSLEAMAAAFPLPTTSPTLMGTHPGEIRTRYENSKEPIFSWRDAARNAVVFLTSTSALADYSQTPEFRASALAPTTGVIVLLPNDASEWRASGFLEWLKEHDRLRVLRLPLALTDFLLSLRDWAKEGSDPFPIAERAETVTNLKRQVTFYRLRLQAFVAESMCRPSASVPSDIPKRFADIFGRIGDKDAVTLAVQQSFENLGPKVHGFLVDLRDLVVNSKTLWGKTGHISLSEDLLPHRAARTERVEAAKVVDDIRSVFSAYGDTLRRLASFVNEDEIIQLTDDIAGKVALRSLWQTKRGASDLIAGQLAQYHAQVSDFIRTLTVAIDTEAALKKYGVLATFGPVGVLMEALPYLQKVATDTTALLATPGGADRHLVAALFEWFLAELVDAVESDVNDAKTAVSSVKGSMKSLEAHRKRILESARTDSAQFAGLDAKALTKLLDDLQRDALATLATEPSLQDTATALENTAKDFESVENAMSRLDSAYQDISDFSAKQPWKSDPSSA